jgi:hypothetical protein
MPGEVKEIGQAKEATGNDPLASLIETYLKQLRQRGRDAPLPLKQVTELPKEERSQAVFTLRLMRACWGLGSLRGPIGPS